MDRAILRTRRDYLIANMARQPESFVQQVAVKLLQEVPGQNSEVFEAKIPSYLEPVE